MTASVLIATEAVGCRALRSYLGRTHYLRCATNLLSQRGDLTNVSRKEFDGVVAMNRQVERMVRSLDVRAAHAHARASIGQPFVAARSEINGAASRAASALSSRKQRAFGWRTPSYPLRTRTVGMSRFLKRVALQRMAAIGAAAEAVASGRGSGHVMQSREFPRTSR